MTCCMSWSAAVCNDAMQAVRIRTKGITHYCNSACSCQDCSGMIIADYKTPCAPRSSEKAASIFIFHISYLGGTQRRSGARALADPALVVTTCPICVTNRALYMISSVEKQRYTFYLFWLRNETDTVVFIIRARSSSPNGCCCSAQAGLLGLFFGLACCSLLFCPLAEQPRFHLS